MSGPRIIQVKKDVLAKNDQIAEENRKLLASHGVTAINLLSSPGSGKTSLLVKTLIDMRDNGSYAVIEGDQRTDHDAARIAETGVRVTQLNTVSACHLDAAMTKKALDEIGLDGVKTLFIENVGNLVCPASYDLGEKAKVALLSVTEGDDKPAKYPKMFRVAQVMVITKTDLLPHVDFDVERCITFAKNINPGIGVLKLSAKTGEGLDEWYDYINDLAGG